MKIFKKHASKQAISVATSHKKIWFALNWVPFLTLWGQPMFPDGLWCFSCYTGLVRGNKNAGENGFSSEKTDGFVIQSKSYPDTLFSVWVHLVLNLDLRCLMQALIEKRRTPTSDRKLIQSHIHAICCKRTSTTVSIMLCLTIAWLRMRGR